MNYEFVEFGGRGGVYQHTVELANALAAGGATVVIHTASDCELAPNQGVRLCRCFDWKRSQSGLRRRIGLMVSVLKTLLHLTRSTADADLVNVQGAAPTCGAAVVLLAAARRRVWYSPHNSFARSGSAIERRFLSLGVRLATGVFVFATSDIEELSAKGARQVVQIPLVQYVPMPTEESVRDWRSRLADRDGSPVVALVGQIRPDKRPGLFLRAAALIPGVSIAIVGEDKGAHAEVVELARQLGIAPYVDDRYLDLEDFVAVIKASDVVVTPYRVASQSGVLAVAAIVGTATVAAAVGGLGEVSTVAVAEDTPEAYAAGIRKALSMTVAPDNSWTARTVAAYGEAGRR